MVDHHAIGAYSHRKGKSLESATANKLSAWYTKTGKLKLAKAFYVVPSSGALKWGESMNVDGDVTADPKIKFNYAIECKNYEGWTIENLLKGNFKFPEWVGQAVREAYNIKRVPLLVYKRKYVKPFVTAPYNAKLTKYFDPYVVKTVEYKSELTSKKESLKTITFMLDDLIKYPYDEINHLYDDVDWKKQITKPKVKAKKAKKPAKVADEILDKLGEL